MKRLIWFFILVFLAGIAIGGFLAKRELERGKSPNPGTGLSRDCLSVFLSHAGLCSGGLCLQAERNRNDLDFFISYRLPPSEKKCILRSLKQKYPELSRMETKGFSRLSARYEFFPGGPFYGSLPSELYRAGHFELGFGRFGERVFAAGKIPIAVLRPQDASPVSESVIDGSREPSRGWAASRWTPLAILLVCIVLGFILLLLLNRREK